MGRLSGPSAYHDVGFRFHHHFHVVCQTARTALSAVRNRENREERSRDVRGVRLPLRTFGSEDLTRRSGKEVIQPQVPLRLPCYDFAPVMTLAFGRSAPCGFLHGLRALATSMA